jgi:hypothetical protein
MLHGLSTYYRILFKSSSRTVFVDTSKLIVSNQSEVRHAAYRSCLRDLRGLRFLH